MVNLTEQEKNNVKMLGIMVRFNRVSQGYSLRDLAKITNISHTLISNFEKGIVIPHKDTIKDIFDKLNLKFYDSPDISQEFNEYYKRIFKHIMFYEYKQAGELISVIEKNALIYENSVILINFAIIKCLYYTITNIHNNERDYLMEKYQVVLNFFSSNQKQLFYFIQGLGFLNKEYYKEAREFFIKALNIGDNKIDLLINEYYVIALSKSAKYVDAWRIASESIEKFEFQTNYVRAMRLRTRIAHDYIRITHYDEATELYEKVLDYSLRYNVVDLTNTCYVYLANIALLKENHQKADKYLKKVEEPFSKNYYYIKFDLAVYKRDEKELLRLYKECMDSDWIENSIKTKKFLEMILMRYDKKYMKKHLYIKYAKEQINLGFECDDAELIYVATTFLTNIYKQNRMYKDAFEANERYLHYIKYGVK